MTVLETIAIVLSGVAIGASLGALGLGGIGRKIREKLYAKKEEAADELAPTEEEAPMPAPEEKAAPEGEYSIAEESEKEMKEYKELEAPPGLPAMREVHEKMKEKDEYATEKAEQAGLEDASSRLKEYDTYLSNVYRAIKEGSLELNDESIDSVLDKANSAMRSSERYLKLGRERLPKDTLAMTEEGKEADRKMRYNSRVVWLEGAAVIRALYQSALDANIESRENKLREAVETVGKAYDTHKEELEEIAKDVEFARETLPKKLAEPNAPFTEKPHAEELEEEVSRIVEEKTSPEYKEKFAKTALGIEAVKEEKGVKTPEELKEEMEKGAEELQAELEARGEKRYEETIGREAEIKRILEEGKEARPESAWGTEEEVEKRRAQTGAGAPPEPAGLEESILSRAREIRDEQRASTSGADFRGSITQAMREAGKSDEEIKAELEKQGFKELPGVKTLAEKLEAVVEEPEEEKKEEGPPPMPGEEEAPEEEKKEKKDEDDSGEAQEG